MFAYKFFPIPVKKLFLAVLLVMLAGLAGWLVLAGRNPQGLPSLVTLPDGTSIRIIAVTYGTNHVVGSKLARVTARLPSVLQGILVRVFGSRAVPAQKMTTPTPELLVWVDHQTNRLGVKLPGPAYCTAFLGDGSNFISGPEVYMSSYLPWSMVEAIHFTVFPRRDREITLNIFDHNATGVASRYASLLFANPVYRNYPDWQSETLPATKRMGDLEVTLQGVETGHDNNLSYVRNKNGSYSTIHGTNRVDGRNNTAVELKLRPLGNSNELWQVAGVEVSDATSNIVHNSGMSSGANGAELSFEPGLWPGESAWKLKLTLKRMEGFRREEIIEFKNVPLGEVDHTNVIGWTTNVAGAAVTIQDFKRRAPIANNQGFSSSSISTAHIALPQIPAGTELDLLRVVFDTGETNHPDFWTTSGTERDYGFRAVPPAAKTGDFTFAIQQSRTVEFTVKPELPKMKAEAGK